MKKRIGMMCIIGILLLANFNISMATENTITLEASKQEVKVDEEFTVTIEQSYGENCASIEGNIEYDEAFEFVKMEEEDWANLGKDDTNIQAIPKREAPESVFVYTFKAKSNVENGKISFKNIKVSVIEDGKSKSYELEEQSVSVTTVKELSTIEVTKNPSTTTYQEGDKFNPNGMQITATYKDGTTKVVTDYTYAPNGTLKTSDKQITITYTENDVTKTIALPITVNAAPIQKPDNNDNNNNNDKNNNNPNNNTNTNNNANTNQNKANTTQNTQNVAKVSNVANTTDTSTSNSVLPKTGKQTIAIVVLAVLIVIGFVFYKQYEKYKDI